jgi:nitroreductase
MTASIGRFPWKVSQQDFPSSLPVTEQLRYLLRYAILAPSSRNTQPWKFSVAGDTIGLFADYTRWQPVADRGRRELYISLGCALENLLVAAEHFGIGYGVRYFPEPENEELAATIALHPGPTRTLQRTGIPLDSLTTRRTQHGMYQDRPISDAARRRLLLSCCDLGLRVDLTDDAAIRSKVVELNLHADEMEFADPAFRHELAHAIGQGTLGKSRLASWLAGMVVSGLNLGRAVGKRNAAMLSSAPFLGLISAKEDDRVSQLKTGQALERIWLHTTAMGIGLQPMSQAVEVPSLRAELARVIPGGGWVPQQVFRLGYPRHTETGHTPRRSLDQVLLG